jgi:hypothetical protein
MTAGFRAGDSFVKGSEYPSIFTVAGCADYRKIMVQWGFDVGLWLQNDLDVLRAYCCYPRGETVMSEAALHLYNAVFYWTDPWSIMAYEKIRPHVNDSHDLKIYRQIDGDIASILRCEPARTFAIIHYPLPHAPYILNPDGSYRGPDPANRITASAEGYERNLACVDRVVGEIVNNLEKSGRLDDCVLILTSDHSWRSDPQVSDKSDKVLTHVPLIVKLPGQDKALNINSDFRTWRLGEIIAKSLRDNDDAQQIAASLESASHWTAHSPAVDDGIADGRQ